MSGIDPDSIDDLLRAGKAIPFCDESPDNEHSGITWTIVGLIESNEIVVIARRGSLRIAKRRESYLAYPTMADRIFGIDQADQALAMELADEIWQEHAQELLSETAPKA